MKNYRLAQMIAANNMDEQEAIKGYLELLELMQGIDGVDLADVAQIEEIISDEKEHAHRLTEMAFKYDGGIVEAED
jgi:rubrerythrin